MALYPADQLTDIINGWIRETMTAADQAEFEKEYNQYLDDTQGDFDEDAYVKHMESEGFFKSLEDPSYYR